jgi:hypothetical protein
VVSDSTMISGWFSGQPVAKAVTKSAAVDRFVIGRHPFEIRVVVTGNNRCRRRTAAAHGILAEAVLKRPARTR